MRDKPVSSISAVAPRKLPRQSRSASTVQVIVEAAARLLERGGASGFNTNNVAEIAGVSIGSLYQYFPNKDAIVRALIERQAKLVAANARAALAAGDLDQALTALVEVAVENQLGRPRLARLQEDEEMRLAHSLDLEAEALGVRDALCMWIGVERGTPLQDTQIPVIVRKTWVRAGF